MGRWVWNDSKSAKQFDDEEFEIVSGNEGDGNRRGMAGYHLQGMLIGTEFGGGIRDHTITLSSF